MATPASPPILEQLREMLAVDPAAAWERAQDWAWQLVDQLLAQPVARRAEWRSIVPNMLAPVLFAYALDANEPLRSDAKLVDLFADQSLPYKHALRVLRASQVSEAADAEDLLVAVAGHEAGDANDELRVPTAMITIALQMRTRYERNIGNTDFVPSQ